MKKQYTQDDCSRELTTTIARPVIDFLHHNNPTRQFYADRIKFYQSVFNFSITIREVKDTGLLRRIFPKKVAVLKDSQSTSLDPQALPQEKLGDIMAANRGDNYTSCMAYAVKSSGAVADFLESVWACMD